VKGGDFSVIGAFHTFVWQLHFSLSPLWQLTTSCISTVFFPTNTTMSTLISNPTVHLWTRCQISVLVWPLHRSVFYSTGWPQKTRSHYQV